MFIDIAKIHVVAGRGGDGKVSFHREKYVASGGPDGGDGGRGGNIVFQIDDHLSTLLDFRYKRKYVAENGASGGSKRMKGKDGKDLIISVPRGTIIRNQADNSIIHDMAEGDVFIVAKGGNGGWGNSHFATPTRQTPRFAKPGQLGQSLDIVLELKLLADVGLLGFPNVGKSTLLSVVSAARPKIANYHFTTLIPNLGVVSVGEHQSFVMADIPGLIEGASEGVGLGHHFLRHVDRCRLLLHLVDVSGSEGRNPIEDIEIINEELRQYNPELAKRKQCIVANKTDLVDSSSDYLNQLHHYALQHGWDFFEISAATGQGVHELMYHTWQILQDLPPILVYEPEYLPEEVEHTPEEVSIQKSDDHTFLIDGPWVQELMRGIQIDEMESRMYLDRRLKESGIYNRLENMGITDGDTVVIDDFWFEYFS